jgi:hypothetical protein
LGKNPKAKKGKKLGIYNMPNKFSDNLKKPVDIYESMG